LAKQAKDEYYNRMLRIQADFDNFRRRSRQEYEQFSLFAGENIVKKVLPVLDSLERAVSCFKEKSENVSWQDGVQLTLKQFQDVLMSEGLEAVQALNAEFDPQIHEAIYQEESENVNIPTVIEELQKGYKFKSKLLRPALVKVAAPKLS
jgi:molecular chaperone GrpE